MASVYDYVINESLGFHVDFDKTLGKQYDELKKSKSNTIPILTESKLDSLIEKSEKAIKQIHRPIYASNSANKADIKFSYMGESRKITTINSQTYEYISLTTLGKEQFSMSGRVSSYNINTFKGRIYIEDEYRPVPFELSFEAQNASQIDMVINSMRENARDKRMGRGIISIEGRKYFSTTGRLKGIVIQKVNTGHN